MKTDKLFKAMQACDLQIRESQRAMMQAIETTIAQGKIACIEAPTGVGKTLAYLLTALNNKTKDESVVVSTATVALQEQIISKDVPLAEKILGRKIKAAIAKGRRRYVCLSRLFHQDQYSDDQKASSVFLKLQAAFEKKAWDGEKESIPRKTTADNWYKISTDSYGCAGGRCNYIDQCPFFLARKVIDTAEVVISNHSLLLSDLELGGGVILPPLDRSLLVIDECHQLAERATDFFALQASVIRSTDWINHFSKSLNTFKTQITLDDAVYQHIQDTIKALVTSLQDVKIYFDSLPLAFDDNKMRITSVDKDLIDLAETLIHFADQFSQCCERVLEKLDSTLELLQDTDKARAEIVASSVASVQFILSRSENLAQTWQHIIRDKDDFGVPIAKWVEKKKTKADPFAALDDDYTCHAAPINASKKLKSLLWNKATLSVILCSATIRSLGTFNDYIRRAGLKHDKRLVTLALESPFDYQKSLFYIPVMKHAPASSPQDVYLQECADLIAQLYLPFVGTLVLFSSRYAMEEVHRMLPEDVQQLVKLQGDTGKAKLIKEHKKHVDKKQTSLLFGLASFAEGLDLPGNYCQHVIIHKVPFSVPSDPIELTRSEWLKSHNLNAFKLVALPRASLKLIQFAGRLIRQETDRGIVTMLDKRLLTKYYGKELMRGLPPFQRLLGAEIDRLKADEMVKMLYDVRQQ
jgi:ATP-dependent DNA helicase DinG